MKHDRYGKKVLGLAFGKLFVERGDETLVDYGAGGTARLDGVIAGMIAVEIESRASKQVRGAVMDLLMHRRKRKAIILLPVHMNSIEMTAAQCRCLLSAFVSPRFFRVVTLKGHGTRTRFLDKDVTTVRRSLRQLL